MGKRRPPPPPCPDPEKYILVRGRYRDFWRKKRFYDSTPELNDAYEKSGKDMKRCAPYNQKIRDALYPYIHDLKTEWLHSRISGRFVKWLKDHPQPSLQALIGLDMQKLYPLRQLMQHGVYHEIDKKEKMIRMEFHPGIYGGVRNRSDVADQYRLRMILIYGKLRGKQPLQSMEASSELLYFLPKRAPEPFVLELPLPEKCDWMLCFRAETWWDGGSVGDAREGGWRLLNVESTKGMVVLDGG
jgi:hypothetical protein